MESASTHELSFNIYAFIAFSGYLSLIILIGVFAARFSSQDINNYFIGGRKMNRFVVALSAVVSGRSSWLLLGVTGMAYTIGLGAVWAIAGYTFAELLLFLYYAPRLRRFSEKHDCITVPDYFAERFNDRSGKLRAFIALIILVFMVSYVSAQLVGGGKAFASSFNISSDLGILITAAIVLVYTVLGGFLAVSLTDVVQAVFMIFALLILPVIAVFDFGGVSAVIAEIIKIDNSLLDPFAASMSAIIGFIGIGLGSPGNPHILARYMSIDDPDKLKFSAIVGTTWNVLMGLGALLIGLAGRAFFPAKSLLLNEDPENIFPLLAQEHLSPIVFGIIIASIFAAIMSTADSQLLVGASSVVRDIWQKFLNREKDVPAKKLVLMSRLIVIVLVILALLLGYLATDLVFWLVLFAWGGLGAALGPTSILALFWKKTTKAGIYAGLTTGTMVIIIWNQVEALKNIIYELVPAFILSLFVTWIISLLTKKTESQNQ